MVSNYSIVLSHVVPECQDGGHDSHIGVLSIYTQEQKGPHPRGPFTCGSTKLFHRQTEFRLAGRLLPGSRKSHQWRGLDCFLSVTLALIRELFPCGSGHTDSLPVK